MAQYRWRGYTYLLDVRPRHASFELSTTLCRYIAEGSVFENQQLTYRSTVTSDGTRHRRVTDSVET